MTHILAFESGNPSFGCKTISSGAHVNSGNATECNTSQRFVCVINDAYMYQVRLSYASQEIKSYDSIIINLFCKTYHSLLLLEEASHILL